MRNCRSKIAALCKNGKPNFSLAKPISLTANLQSTSPPTRMKNKMIRTCSLNFKPIQRWTTEKLIFEIYCFGQKREFCFSPSLSLGGYSHSLSMTPKIWTRVVAQWVQRETLKMLSLGPTKERKTQQISPFSTRWRPSPFRRSNNMFQTFLSTMLLSSYQHHCHQCELSQVGGVFDC